VSADPLSWRPRNPLVTRSLPCRGAGSTYMRATCLDAFLSPPSHERHVPLNRTPSRLISGRRSLGRRATLKPRLCPAADRLAGARSCAALRTNATLPSADTYPLRNARHTMLRRRPPSLHGNCRTGDPVEDTLIRKSRDLRTSLSAGTWVAKGEVIERGRQIFHSSSTRGTWSTSSQSTRLVIRCMHPFRVSLVRD